MRKTRAKCVYHEQFDLVVNNSCRSTWCGRPNVKYDSLHWADLWWLLSADYTLKARHMKIWREKKFRRKSNANCTFLRCSKDFENVSGYICCFARITSCKYIIFVSCYVCVADFCFILSVRWFFVRINGRMHSFMNVLNCICRIYCCHAIVNCSVYGWDSL